MCVIAIASWFIEGLPVGITVGANVGGQLSTSQKLK
jgi:hypothetical protein